MRGRATCNRHPSPYKIKAGFIYEPCPNDIARLVSRPVVRAAAQPTRSRETLSPPYRQWSEPQLNHLWALLACPRSQTETLSPPYHSVVSPFVSVSVSARIETRWRVEKSSSYSSGTGDASSPSFCFFSLALPTSLVRFRVARSLRLVRSPPRAAAALARSRFVASLGVLFGVPSPAYSLLLSPLYLRGSLACCVAALAASLACVCTLPARPSGCGVDRISASRSYVRPRRYSWLSP